mmetsp:Transcript_10266/g.12992  ORF Transcript_10266/g.12992 Transcript_10266/m.12992 type:complete len:578 (+) Transcript_10266:140-1873(+)
MLRITGITVKRHANLSSLQHALFDIVSVTVPPSNRHSIRCFHNHRNITNASASARTFSIGSDSWNWNKSNITHTNSSNLSSGASLSSSAAAAATNESDAPIEPSVQAKILEECSSLHSSIMPFNDKVKGPLAKNSDKGTSLPFVFLVGNHSSGKSSFVNYVLGRNVQTAGVAPTDDCFTVIAPGPEDTDQDGPAFIGDPDMGFSQLRQFGPTLIHHTQLKVRSGTQTSSFMMIDSPGMIDSPMNQSGMTSNSTSSGSGQGSQMDRGYDFQGVVRWYAQRADVVMLFFDPDKPGTTGETLSVLLHSLGGMDHKLLIVLNKADQFKKIHDFARAYGSLCWNLSKVIPRKDLPRIYTMCLPNKNPDGQENSSIGAGLDDLHQSRDDVVAEVMKAPKRRIDNVITHLHDSVNLLLMHALIAQEIQKRYSKMLWDNRVQELASLTAGVSLSTIGMYAQLPMEFTGAAAAVTILGVGGLKWFNTSKLTEAEALLLTMEELSASFQRTHRREVSDADEYTASVWERIRSTLQMSLKSDGLNDFPSISQGDLDELRRILDVEIPKLRRQASPSHVGSNGMFDIFN